MGILFNMAERFKNQPTCEDILKKVKSTEIIGWSCLLISLALTFGGLLMIILPPVSNIKVLLLGLFTAVFGGINIVYFKLWGQIRITALYTIWESINRVEAEIRKSEAADL